MNWAAFFKTLLVILIIPFLGFCFLYLVANYFSIIVSILGIFFFLAIFRVIYEGFDKKEEVNK